MIYVDTNVIISYMDELDSNHAKAVALLEKLKNEKLVASKLTLVELASVYSRAGLKDPIALAIYSIEEVGVHIANIDFNEVLTSAFRLADELKLRTLDLLHIAACKLIGANRFATFDKDIIGKKNLVSKLGIDIVTVDEPRQA